MPEIELEKLAQENNKVACQRALLVSILLVTSGFSFFLLI